MDGDATLMNLAKALAGLRREAIAEMRLAEQYAAAVRDADRWGLRAEADVAAFEGRCCRVNTLLLGAKIVITRAKLEGCRL